MGKRKLKSNSNAQKQFKRTKQEEENESVEERRNPLDIPEILAMVASYITKVDDLKSVRLLGRNWRDETLKTWRNTAVFVISKASRPVILKAFDASHFIGLTGKRQKERVQAEIDPFRFRQFPFKRYRIKNDPSISVLETGQIRDNIIKPYATYLDGDGELFHFLPKQVFYIYAKLV